MIPDWSDDIDYTPAQGWFTNAVAQAKEDKGNYSPLAIQLEGTLYTHPIHLNTPATIPTAPLAHTNHTTATASPLHHFKILTVIRCLDNLPVCNSSARFWLDTDDENVHYRVCLISLFFRG